MAGNVYNFPNCSQKIMKAEEGDETTGQIDKKTLIKLVLRLEAEGLLKTYSYLLKAKSRLEKLTIVCLPHIPAGQSPLFSFSSLFRSLLSPNLIDSTVSFTF